MKFKIGNKVRVKKDAFVSPLAEDNNKGWQLGAVGKIVGTHSCSSYWVSFYNSPDDWSLWCEDELVLEHDSKTKTADEMFKDAGYDHTGVKSELPGSYENISSAGHSFMGTCTVQSTIFFSPLENGFANFQVIIDGGGIKEPQIKGMNIPYDVILAAAKKIEEMRGGTDEV